MVAAVIHGDSTGYWRDGEIRREKEAEKGEHQASPREQREGRTREIERSGEDKLALRSCEEKQEQRGQEQRTHDPFSPRSAKGSCLLMEDHVAMLTASLSSFQHLHSLIQSIS
jgi:hypothetical protein